ncbi:MAG: HD-GYP domain-containing protein, partial [Deltaproteobacteria bacterium]|nr:HD-GYP domain-containing protein [Deltaproteobacteria bacterium]
KKIDTDKLQPGVYVCGFEKEGGEKLSFMNNLLVKDRGDIERFLRNGFKTAYVVTSPAPEKGGAPSPARGAPSHYSAAAEAAPSGTGGAAASLEEIEKNVVSDREDAPTEDTAGFDAEIGKAREIRDEAESLVRGFMHEARMGRSIKPREVNATVEKMIDSIFHNRDAITSLTRLKSADDYTFAHCVNVCILSVAVGRHIGFDRRSLQDLGVGAILHDIGKTLVPEEILKKPGALTKDEFDVMKRHVELGGNLLADTREIKTESMHVVMQHHERYGGLGYPGGIPGKEIHLYARVAAVADVYDAMTSRRVYQTSLMPDEALKKMYLMRETHFEPGLVERLIKCLGIYPIGTLVLLNTGEAAVVKYLNHSNPLRPRVLMLSGADKKPLSRPFEVDLKRDGLRLVVSSKRPGDSPAPPDIIA